MKIFPMVLIISSLTTSSVYSQDEDECYVNLYGEKVCFVTPLIEIAVDIPVYKAGTGGGGGGKHNNEMEIFLNSMSSDWKKLIPKNNIHKYKGLNNGEIMEKYLMKDGVINLKSYQY